MTASRTWRSRSLRDAAMAAKLLTANNLDHLPRAGQVTHQCVQTEPALGRAHEPVARKLYPARAVPGGQTVGRTSRLWQPRCGAQREIHPLEFPLLRGELLLAIDGRPPRGDRGAVGLPCRHVPAASCPVERVGRRTEAEVGTTSPVRRVVT